MERTARTESEDFLTSRIVIKIGTSTITAGKNQPDMDLLRDIARQSAELLKTGIGVAIVSSGAVALGRGAEDTGESITDKQAYALEGQSKLIATWRNAFEAYGIEHVGQALYTDADFKERANSVREVLLKGLSRGPVIINYNDAVADEEMRKVEKSVDNDTLAGNVARLLDADLLILTDVDGVIDQGELLPWVERLEDIEELLHSGGTGTGGAKSKWVEAKRAAQLGKISVIANGRTKDVVLDVAKGKMVGTRFIHQSYMFPKG